MAIDNDRSLLEQQILSNSGLKGKDLENLKAFLATLSVQQLQAELSKALSGENKWEWYTGVLLEHNESVVMKSNYDQITYTDNNGNEISELKDGENVLERTIKSTDDKGNVFVTHVTYSEGKPLALRKSRNGNTTETTTFKYNMNADVPFVTVETTKSDRTKITTNTSSITEKGEVVNDYIIDKTTVKPDGTKITLTPKIIDLKAPLNNKKIFYKGESMEEVEETCFGKKKTTYYEGINFQSKGRRILLQTNDNTIYYNSSDKPVYNHREYVKKQQQEAYKKEFEKRLERNIPLKGTHTNILNANNVTLGKAKNITVKEFITNILGIDINSETGKKLADRFVMLPDEELQKISYADYEAQTLGLSNFAPKTNDYSGKSFEEIARDLRQNSGVNIETQAEITQHKIQMQIRENTLKQRENKLGITIKKQAAELLSDMHENAANMYENYYFSSNHLHKVADLLVGYISGTDDAGKVRKYRELAKDYKQLTSSSNKEFEAKFKELTGGKDYDEEAVKNVLDNVQGFTNALVKSFQDEFKNKKDKFKELYKMEYSDKAIMAVVLPLIRDHYADNTDFRILCYRAFGFSGSKEVKEGIQSSATIDNFGELALIFATMGYGETLQGAKLLNEGTNALSKTLAKNVSKFSGKTTGKIAGFMPKVINSAVKMDIASYSVNLVNTGDTNSALQAGINGAEMGAAGALIGATTVRGTQILTDNGLELLINDARALSRYMKYIPKPSEKTCKAVSKLFKTSEEVNAQTFMETVLRNQGASGIAQSTGFIAEVAGFEVYNIVMQKLKNEIDPATGKLPPEWDEIFTTNYLLEHFKSEFDNIRDCRAVSRFIMWAIGAKNAQKLILQENLSRSKSLAGIRVRELKAGEQTGYELTKPDGKKIIATNLKEAEGYLNYQMQLELISDSVKEKEGINEGAQYTKDNKSIEIRISELDMSEPDLTKRAYEVQKLQLEINKLRETNPDKAQQLQEQLNERVKGAYEVIPQMLNQPVKISQAKNGEGFVIKIDGKEFTAKDFNEIESILQTKAPDTSNIDLSNLELKDDLCAGSDASSMSDLEFTRRRLVANTKYVPSQIRTGNMHIPEETEGVVPLLDCQVLYKNNKTFICHRIAEGSNNYKVCIFDGFITEDLCYKFHDEMDWDNLNQVNSTKTINRVLAESKNKPKAEITNQTYNNPQKPVQRHAEPRPVEHSVQAPVERKPAETPIEKSISDNPAKNNRSKEKPSQTKDTPIKKSKEPSNQSLDIPDDKWRKEQEEYLNSLPNYGFDKEAAELLNKYSKRGWHGKEYDIEIVLSSKDLDGQSNHKRLTRKDIHICASGGDGGNTVLSAGINVGYCDDMLFTHPVIKNKLYASYIPEANVTLINITLTTYQSRPGRLGITVKGKLSKAEIEGLYEYLSQSIPGIKKGTQYTRDMIVPDSYGKDCLDKVMYFLNKN